MGIVLLTWCPSARPCSTAASSSSEATTTRSVDLRAPADLEELNLFKGVGSHTKILKQADEIGTLGTDTDNLLSGTTLRPARVSNIMTNDSCSDKIKVAMQMGVAQEDLFVECPLPPQSGNIKTRAALNEPASASTRSASAKQCPTAQTNYITNTDAMLGASSCNNNKLPISFFPSIAKRLRDATFTIVDRTLRCATTLININSDAHKLGYNSDSMTFEMDLKHDDAIMINAYSPGDDTDMIGNNAIDATKTIGDTTLAKYISILGVVTTSDTTSATRPATGRSCLADTPSQQVRSVRRDLGCLSNLSAVPCGPRRFTQ